MNKKVLALLLCAALLLTGCSLAQPEPAAPHEDRLMGVYLVPWTAGEDLREDENWEEYGAFQVDTEFGALNIPQRILRGVQDADHRELVFPGLSGYAVTVAEYTNEAGSCTTSYNDLADSSFHVLSTDAGTSYEISGTLYVGDLPESTTWSVYHIYAMEDGTLYLNGHGNSYSGSPTGFGTTLTENVDTTVNGEETGSVSTKVEVHVEYRPQPRKLEVLQYNAAGEEIERCEIPVKPENATVSWNPGAAWAVVAETTSDGMRYTLVSPAAEGEEQPVFEFYPMDERQVGIQTFLFFE